MALSISRWRKGNRLAETPQESPQQEPPVRAEAGDTPALVTAKEIVAAAEKIKAIRPRLRNNARVEAWKVARLGLSRALADIDLRAKDMEKNRADLLLNDRDPDSLLRQLAQEKRQTEQNLENLKVAALQELSSIHGQCAAAVNEVSSAVWKQWRQFRKDLLTTLELYGDLDERLGVPVASLAREAEQFNTAFGDVRRDMPGSGSLQAPVQVPRLGRGWDWGTFNKVVVAIRQWLV